ncbi:MAG: glycosyltransferase family 4 protein [Actinomycetota bacterium]|nr:glycosyltransferase family 4 protein [Actinomycetota bacterium]
MIGISLLTLVPGIVGGSETYARELVRALARVGTLPYRVFVPTIAEDAGDGLPSRTITAYRASRSMSGRALAMSRAAFAPGRILEQFEIDELDAVHFPLNVMLPRVRRPPAVATVLDIQHVFFPQFFPRSERAYRRLVYGWTVRLARRVIAPSVHVKETLVERFGVDADKIRVVHLGLDHASLRPGDGEREPFLLYPANPWPHKNHERLFEALALVRRKRPELRLVLTGTGHEGRPVPPGVDVRGRVPDDELVRLYQRASALIFPSLYEGFGQPPLEAMACGCPVAVSNAGSLPEVCGDAARYFDPFSVEAIAEAIEVVLERPGDLVAKGLARAARFTWDETATRHEAVYREVIPLASRAE